MNHFARDRQRAILIVDNCLEETHRSLTAVCAEAASTLSLITVEYDVGEDEPEKTEVFRLEPSSEGLIERLLEHRMPHHTSEVDRRRMAELSGGNARLALALASTVTRGESIAKLTDNELFKRLFQQRQDPDSTLLKAAEACSLVYSFDGETLTGEGAELPLLASLAGMTTDQFYGHVAELQRRQLVQRRGLWRAVLPQALAIWLARRALQDFHRNRVEAAMRQVPSGRLLRSFSRRLGYLHDSEDAQKIVEAWLSPDGCLENLGQLNRLGAEILRNIAPVQQDLVLDKLEQLISGHNEIDLSDQYIDGQSTWIYILKSLAYEPKYFDRAALLLARLAIAEPEGNNYNSARNSFKLLFQLYLSGTLALVDQRLLIIETLLADKNPANHDLAIEALNTMLEAANFSGSSDPDFGARPRTYGWHPTDHNGVVAWYKPVISFCQSLALSGSPHKDKTRAVLAEHFGFLWSNIGMFDELDTMARTLNAGQYWAGGWLAVRQTIRSDSGQMPEREVTRLRDLEKALRPSDLRQNAWASLSWKYSWDFALDDGALEEGMIRKTPSQLFEQTENQIVDLWCQISTQTILLDELLPTLIIRKNRHGWSIGRGLALGANSLSELWERLVMAFSATPEVERNEHVLLGFIAEAAKRENSIASGLLDAAIAHPVLGPVFPQLQHAVEIDERGLKRLEASVSKGLAPAGSYSYLCRTANSISPRSLRRLLLDIASLPEGLNIAIENLQLLFDSANSTNNGIDEELVQCGRDLLRHCRFERDHNPDFYELAVLVRNCLSGTDAALDTAIFCRRLVEAIANSSISIADDMSEILESLFHIQTHIALDEFIDNELDNLVSLHIHIYENHRGNVLRSATVESLVSWAQSHPTLRFKKLAAAIPLFAKSEQSNDLEWSAVALKLLEFAPDKSQVLAEYKKRFQPSGWSGSLADLLEKYRALPRALLCDPNPEIAAWAREQDAHLALKAKQRREEERERDRQIDERFE